MKTAYQRSAGWRRFGLGILALGLAMGARGAIAQAFPADKAASRLCPADLAAEIDEIADQPPLQRGRLGILVETLGATKVDRQTLYARDAERYFIPASNAKLFTTAAALRGLGPDFRMRTSVYGTTHASGLTTLRVVGRGDPSLTDEKLAGLAQQLYQQGIRRVTNLIGDEHYFPGSAVNPNWEWEDVQSGYGAPVNSLILNRNAMGLRLLPQALGQPLQVVWDNPAWADQWRVENTSRTVASNESEHVDVGRDLSQPILRVTGQLVVGSRAETAAISIPNPGAYFLQQFRRTLETAKITVVQTALTTTPTATLPPELAAIDSPPLSELLKPINQKSRNLYAEALLKSLGIHSSAQPPLDATEAGIVAVQTILNDIGVDPESYTLADGSGLSRHNLTTPTALVNTLQGMAATPEAAIYKASLSVAGVNGTLRNRFRGSPLAGRLQGKSGFVSSNASLSGYLSPPNHPPLVFSILVNNINQPGRQLRRTIDQIVHLLAKLQSC
ncbi:MAG: D-alanyl-D-alanine carboxypeptidase/D-alanyl-D-alanine-endopeptidase [Leptolyngbyaceae cyanobacterium MO_188.B28]|nr:D-alanyl-D-alanine carboxypeptidase/D-alanyl-D-alanine-endopeptidase [Leptolyngbyaceae cyanobacterium MO_188.B28]